MKQPTDKAVLSLITQLKLILKKKNASRRRITSLQDQEWPGLHASPNMSPFNSYRDFS